MRFIDLTKPLTPRSPAFPGDPKTHIEPIASIAKDGFAGHRIDMGVHAGTHVDAPAHMIAGGAMLSDVPVERFFGRGVLVDARGKNPVTAEALANVHLRRGDIVLVSTGWSERSGNPGYFTDYPEIASDFAQTLISAGVLLLGLDTPSPDRPDYPVHKLLLDNNVLIIENLDGLDQLVGIKTFEVIALPAKWEADAAAVRVVAKIP